MKKKQKFFTRLRLANWRNFKSVDVTLGERVFIIGPNASGKSNLLDVFRFLQDIASVGGGLQAAVQKRGGMSAVRCLAARQRPEVSIYVEIGDKSDASEWEYEVAFNEKGKRLQIQRERVAHKGKVIISRPDEEDKIDPERLTQTFLEQVNVNRDFRPIAEFFSSATYIHIVPQLLREPERYIGRRNDPYGGDFLEQIARVPERTRNRRLDRILEALRVAVPQLKELHLERDQVSGTWHLKGRYEHWRPRGAWQDERQLSDGTLRLLGLLWALLDEGGPLLLEEPELSLHPDVVRQLPSLMYRSQRRSGRQVIISTHSFDLLRGKQVGLHEILMLIPGREGTIVQSPKELKEIQNLVESGMDVGEAVLPLTRPKGVEQLSFW